MSNIDMPRVVREMADTVGDLLAAAENACGPDAGAQLAKVETTAAKIYATAVQSRAQLTSGLAAALAILHYGHLVPSLQEPAPTPAQTPPDETTRERRRANAASASGLRTKRGSRSAPSR